jgi:hypothetical protein
MNTMIRIASIVVCLAALSACSKPAAEQSAAAGVRVNGIEVGRTLGTGKVIADKTADFSPSDTIYLSVETSGSAAQATVAARWTYQDGQVVKEQSEAIAPSGPAHTEFHMAKPDGWPTGKYSVAVSLNGAAAGSKDFTVK